MRTDRIVAPPASRRCPACNELAYDIREPVCDACGYRPACQECGQPIDPRDHDPERAGFDTSECHGRALDAAWAENGIEDQ